MKKIILSIFTLSLLVFSCSNDDDLGTPVVPLGAYENGILISAEGGPSSISYVSNDFSASENQIYFNVNDENLGTYLQSIAFNEDQAYIVVDDGTITIVNRYTFEKLSVISTGLELPRYMTFANGKGYVSNWGDPFNATDDFIAVIDLQTNTVIETIAVSEGPEQLIVNANKLFVSHKGGYATNNKISVIDTSSDTLATTITVSDNPDEMIINNNGELVILCSGKFSYQGAETLGSITKIDMSNNTILTTLHFSEGIHPDLMAYDNGTLYYTVFNDVFSISDADTTLDSTSNLTLSTATLYGMAARNGNLYFADAKDFSSNGELLIYDSNTLTETNSFNVGVVASKIYFN